MTSFWTKCVGLKFLILFASAMTTCAFAVTENSNGDAAKRGVSTTLQQRMQKPICVDFRNAPIEDVIRILADQADVDIIKGSKVAGNVTAKLTDVPLAEALDTILASHGYDYILGKNMIRIASLGELTEETERLISRIYRITYADVAQVEKALMKFISKRGSLSASLGSSNIIVTDTESKIRAIDAFIEEIDRQTAQVLVEVRIYDVTSRDKLDVGIEWTVGRNTTFAAGPIGTNPTAGSRDPFSTGGFSAPTSKTATSTQGFFRFGLLDQNIDLDMQLRAEQEDVTAKLLANPRILVLDNETALFDIVTEHPYVERTITEGTVTETVKFKEVGVKLEVTPHITREGMVRLHIIPEFGVFVERVTVATSDVPVVDTRKVNTIALVKDGQTVVIGGLRKKNASKEVNKIPFLGDLPLLGVLFRFEGEDTAVTELLVFITPRIIEQEPVMSEDEQNAYEETKFSGPELVETKAEASEE